MNIFQEMDKTLQLEKLGTVQIKSAVKNQYFDLIPRSNIWEVQ